MPDNRRRTGRRVLALDLAFLSWRDERRRERALELQAVRIAAAQPVVRPFTFRDVPDEVAEAERNLVLIPQVGVKS